MILNVSGRTDVVAFYSKWFMSRYDIGFLDVRNPFYPKKVSRIFFEDVDAILFCTKNPVPILNSLVQIRKPIIFHITLTPYRKDIEPNVPPKGIIINAIKKISEIIGSDNVFVRYDPIFISDKYSLDYHIKSFNKMCELLDGHVKNIIVSFVDNYKNVKKNHGDIGIKDFNDDDYIQIGINFAESARKHNMTVQTCFEDKRLIEYGFIKEECITKDFAYLITGKDNFKKATSRKGNKCSCIATVDIGVYNSCRHYCKYCYANFDENKVDINFKLHDPTSSLLIGHLDSDDDIKRRTI